MILAGIPDLIDGAVAKASGTSNPRGAFFDSVTDRVTDAMLFGGVAWYFTTISNGPLPVLPFAVFASAALVSYVRAKADALGFDAHVGLVERAERFILLGFGLLFDNLLVATLWIMLVLNLITAGQRFVKVWNQATVPRIDQPCPGPVAGPPVSARRPRPSAGARAGIEARSRGIEPTRSTPLSRGVEPDARSSSG